MTLTAMNRYQALGIHLGISFIIFLALSWAVFYVWFPGVFFDTENGIRALALIAGVDLVLGPLLTFIVFDTAKKSLKMDLAIIGLLQVSALTAGAYLLHDKRPVGIILIAPQNGAQTIYANNLDSEALEFIQLSQEKLYFYKVTSAPVSAGDKVSASDYKLTRANLIPFSNEDAKRVIADTLPHRLPLDKGFKDDVFINILEGGTIQIAKAQAANAD